MGYPPNAMTRLEKGPRRGEDGLLRCSWVGSDPLYLRYHDREWGFPVASDPRLFEKICLEGFQSGLSWLTILRKREAFRAAFRGFDFTAIARFGRRDVARLLANAGIVRHRGKIESPINNARRALALVAERGSLASYFWSFEPPPADRPRRLTWQALRQLASTRASTALSRDLKKRGWTFVGPTTAYAFMQAMRPRCLELGEARAWGAGDHGRHTRALQRGRRKRARAASACFRTKHPLEVVVDQAHRAPTRCCACGRGCCGGCPSGATADPAARLRPRRPDAPSPR
jgi:DNA-3-methyladenine glycosylase I